MTRLFLCLYSICMWSYVLCVCWCVIRFESWPYISNRHACIGHACVRSMLWCMSQEIVLYHCSMLPCVAVCGVHCVAVRQCVAVCYTPASGHASLCSMSRCMNMYFSRCVCVHVGRCAYVCIRKCVCVYYQGRWVHICHSQCVCVCMFTGVEHVKMPVNYL